MLHSHQLGAIRATGIVEYFGPTHVPSATFPDFDPVRFAVEKAKLAPHQYAAVVDRLIVAIQIWIVHAGPNVIVIDTGVGNAKPRPTPRMNMLNTLALQWMEAAGAPPDKVTHVVMTHLHSDHVGWNTRLAGDRWQPTFVNARYHLPAKDFAYFKDRHERGLVRESSFADSVLPVVDAGLADFVSPGDEIAHTLVAEAAYGHTPGQLNYRIRSDGSEGVFSGDIFHSPLQVAVPEWNTAFCVDADAARATRAAFLASAADSGALVMPCHFGPPHCGYIRRQGAGFTFEPAAPGSAP